MSNRLFRRKRLFRKIVAPIAVSMSLVQSGVSVKAAPNETTKGWPVFKDYQVEGADYYVYPMKMLAKELEWDNCDDIKACVEKVKTIFKCKDEGDEPELTVSFEPEEKITGFENGTCQLYAGGYLSGEGEGTEGETIYITLTAEDLAVLLEAGSIEAKDVMTDVINPKKLEYEKARLKFRDEVLRAQGQMKEKEKKEIVIKKGEEIKEEKEKEIIIEVKEEVKEEVKGHDDGEGLPLKGVEKEKEIIEEGKKEEKETGDEKEKLGDPDDANQGVNWVKPAIGAATLGTLGMIVYNLLPDDDDVNLRNLDEEDDDYDDEETYSDRQNAREKGRYLKY